MPTLPEGSVQTGTLGNAQVYKEAVTGQERRSMAHAWDSSAHLTPGGATPRNGHRGGWGNQRGRLCSAREGMAGQLGSEAPRNESGTRAEDLSKDTKVESSDPGEPRQPLLPASTKALNSVLLRNESSAMIKPQRSHKKKADIDKMGC